MDFIPPIRILYLNNTITRDNSKKLQQMNKAANSEMLLDQIASEYLLAELSGWLT